MQIFQKSIVNKYLNLLNENEILNAYETYNKYFKNIFRLTNIMHLKEENYQEGFLRELFVDVLGYTINPNEKYNLTTEFKNQTDNKKADGAILKNEKAIGVIELKSTKLLDLKFITNQAFNYKHNNSECRYVITSNFHYLRFYIDNSVEYEEFDLFKLDFENFKSLYLFLSKESIFSDIPLKMKNESKQKEEDITTKFYRDYKLFKNNIFENLKNENSQYDNVLLFQKTQKLLDRVLFIAFAEDKGLIPPNTLLHIIETWKYFVNEGQKLTLYNQFQTYFTKLNDGYTNPEWGIIPAYNGGLFAKDIILDNKLILNNEILKNGILSIAKYDFNTEIDVYILGHIFEHSLNELDEFLTLPKLQTSKRKKDGVFYTPEYITKYIIENSIGELCKQKQKELNLLNQPNLKNISTKKQKLNKSEKEYFEKLQNYKNWLFNLKILDPSCGSGAFLIAVLDFLIQEHKQTDDFIYQLTNESIKLFDLDKTILEKNIYGVDINEESCEISKLSLWLHTAKRDRKLSDLSQNIKCGNSLIDSFEYAKEKAFDWNIAFPEIMKNGGFDCIIGNPPYVRQELLKPFKQFFSTNYKTFTGKSDLLIYFFEKGMQLLKTNGLLGFIVSNKFLKSGYGQKLTQFLQQNYLLKQLIDFGDIQIFDGATTYPCIIFLEKIKPNEKIEFKYFKLKEKKDIEILNKSISNNFTNINLNINSEKWSFENFETNILLSKIQNKSISLNNYINGKVYYGVKTGNNEAFIINNEIKTKICLNDKKSEEILKPILRGKDVGRYNSLWKDFWLINLKRGIDIEQYPAIKLHLEKYKIQLEKSAVQKLKWYEIKNSVAYEKEFLKPKIIYQRFQVKPGFTYDKNNFYINDSLWAIPTDNLFLLAFLNSKIGWFLISTYCTQIQNGYQLIYEYIKNIPILKTNKDNELELSILAQKMLDLNDKSSKIQNKFIKYLFQNFGLKNASTKINNFYKFDFLQLLNELKKQKIELNEKIKYSFIDIFEESVNEINKIEFEIAQNDFFIDNFIYKLYDLKNEDIEIIKNTK